PSIARESEGTSTEKLDPRPRLQVPTARDSKQLLLLLCSASVQFLSMNNPHFLVRPSDLHIACVLRVGCFLERQTLLQSPTFRQEKILVEETFFCLSKVHVPNRYRADFPTA